MPAKDCSHKFRFFETPWYRPGCRFKSEICDRQVRNAWHETSISKVNVPDGQQFLRTLIQGLEPIKI